MDWAETQGKEEREEKLNRWTVFETGSGSPTNRTSGQEWKTILSGTCSGL